MRIKKEPFNPRTMTTANPMDLPSFDSGWLHALGYIRNWINVNIPKPNKQIQSIIDEIKEMETEQWPNTQ